MGSAATYQLAKRGNKVLGIDQYAPPHIYGSTHGDTRITRLAIGEGIQYTPIALRSHQIWREIEQETGKNLLETVGCLIISSPAKTTNNHVPDFYEKTVAAAKKYNIKHDILDAATIRKRFPAFNVKDDEVGYFEYEGGFLRPEACVAANLELAKKYGAEIQTTETVKSFEQKGDVVTVRTNKGEYTADKLIVSAGPWLPELLPEYFKFLGVRRQVMFWFDAKDSIQPFLPKNFPVFIWELQESNQGIYGFPAIDGSNGGVKIASDQYESITTPETVDRTIRKEEAANMYKDVVGPYFPRLSDRCVKAVSCLYTIAPDFHFIIDTHPKYPSVIIASPCSGHGFKHSAGIGEILSQLVVDGKSKIDISGFKLGRFQNQ